MAASPLQWARSCRPAAPADRTAARTSACGALLGGAVEKDLVAPVAESYRGDGAAVAGHVRLAVTDDGHPDSPGGFESVVQLGGLPHHAALLGQDIAPGEVVLLGLPEGGGQSGHVRHGHPLLSLDKGVLHQSPPGEAQGPPGSGIEHAAVAAGVLHHGGVFGQDAVQLRRQALVQQPVRPPADDPLSPGDLLAPGKIRHGGGHGRVVFRPGQVRLELAHGPADDVAVGVQKGGHEAGALQVHFLYIGMGFQQRAEVSHGRDAAIPYQQGLLGDVGDHGADGAVVV